MEPNWATDHLQVIRTLMERAAIYRRALAPIMLLLGILGVISSIIGLVLPINSIRGFGAYWILVSGIGISGAYLKVRKQALKDSEPFWSPPTRRVTQAVLPPLAAGLVVTIVIVTMPTEDLPPHQLDSSYLDDPLRLRNSCGGILHATGN